MRKRLIITLLLFIILIISCFTGCANNKEYKEYKPEYGPQFICVEKYKDPYLGYTCILVDKNTRIMYIFVDNTEYESSGLSVLYDSEGKVRRYMGVISE